MTLANIAIWVLAAALCFGMTLSTAEETQALWAIATIAAAWRASWEAKRWEEGP